MAAKIFSDIEIVEPSGFSYAPRATDAGLDNFESKSGFLLPKSYRAFCKEFGAGELANYYRISSPMKMRTHDLNLSLFNSSYHKENDAHSWDSYFDPQVLKLVFFFGDNIDGEAYYWKLDEVSNARQREFHIYVIPRVYPTKKIADSFKAFIYDVCLKPQKNWRPKHIFCRAIVRR